MTYELMIIISPEADKDSEVEATKGQIEELGGEIKSEDDWGRRTLAYSIHHQTAGNYYLVNFQLAASKVTELKEELRLREGLLRFMVTKVEGGGD